MEFTDLAPKGVISGRAGEDAVSLLTADHLKVQELFRRFDEFRQLDDDVAMEQKERIANELCVELTLHMTLEEEVFYPAVRALTDENELLNEAEIEHEGIKQSIDELAAGGAADPLFNARMKVLAEYVEQHVRQEHAETFRKARAVGMDLVALGEQLSERRHELEQAAVPKLIQAEPERKRAGRKAAVRAAAR